ncbi:TRM11 family SAM-dependent methyltransferase [Bacillus suaedae]|uniref:RNA methyltransferase n=1 Tax=Halalkalibacter suaedae TaxID=2822140 RepID=A0A940WV49_9BACI|nr:RNA methyltransferase [Bacillus suaedae]MBP3951052.1 RNA methyltransferase [Bacillus suaedae]
MEYKSGSLLHYLYTYAYHEDEDSLCKLEMRSFFGYDTDLKMIESPLKIDPSRSPFIKDRIAIFYKGETLEEIAQYVTDLHTKDRTFKVTVVNNHDLIKSEQIEFKVRREIEKEIGLLIEGPVNLNDPDLIFAIKQLKDGWVFGEYMKSESIWLHHQKKPQNYSTALNTRDARAIVNIAVPHPNGQKVIDPCCGIGTVLLEALSMDIAIEGSDRNPLATTGARENILFFGYEGDVLLRNINEITGHYDVAIVDMPYNLCSVLPVEEKLSMLKSARRFTNNVIIITIETIDSIITEAGFKIIDRCVARKSGFIRHVIVCE